MLTLVYTSDVDQRCRQVYYKPQVCYLSYLTLPTVFFFQFLQLMSLLQYDSSTITIGNTITTSILKFFS